MERYHVVNPSWKDLLWLQRKLSQNPRATGFIFISNADMNVMQDWKKIRNYRIVVWYLNKPSKSIDAFFCDLDKRTKELEQEWIPSQ